MSLAHDIVSGPAGAGQALRTLLEAPAFQALDAGTQRELVGAVAQGRGLPRGASRTATAPRPPRSPGPPTCASG